jgi:hypothetical protein
MIAAGLLGLRAMKSASRNLLACALVWWSGSVCAQEAGPISTDRPGVTDSTSQMARGAFQLETGVLFGLAADRVDVAPNQLRFGALSWLELRVGLPGYVHEAGSDGAGGFFDGNLALRFRLRGETEQGRPVPLLQATVGTTVPSGSGRYRVEALQPFGQVVATWLTGSRTTLNVMVQLAGPTDGDERWLQTIVSSSFYVALGPRWSFFLEPALLTGLDADGGTQGVFDGGVLWLVTRELQLDVSGGVNVGGGSTAGFVGAGIAARF